MDLEHLISSGRAELVRGTVRVRDGDKYAIVARQNGDELMVTDTGRHLLAQLSTSVETTTKSPRVRHTRALADGD